MDSPGGAVSLRWVDYRINRTYQTVSVLIVLIEGRFENQAISTPTKATPPPMQSPLSRGILSMITPHANESTMNMPSETIGFLVQWVFGLSSGG